MARKKPNFVTQDRSICPTPDKMYFGTKAKAQKWAFKIAKKMHEKPNKIYQCRCGFWHATRNPSRNQRISQKIKQAAGH